MRSISGGSMRLTLTSSQVNKLELTNDVGWGVCPSEILLLYNKGQDAVRAWWGLIHIVWRHNFILQSLPEVLVCIFKGSAFKYVDILDSYLISQCIHLQFESIGHIHFLSLSFLCVRVKQIVNFLVVKLDVLDFDTDLALAQGFSPFGFNLIKELTDSSRYDALFLYRLLCQQIGCLIVCAAFLWLLKSGRLSINLRHYSIVSFIVHIFVAFHSVSFATTCLSIDENCGVETDKNLFDQEIGPCTTENTLLCAAFIKHLIKLISLHMVLLVHNSICIK